MQHFSARLSDAGSLKCDIENQVVNNNVHNALREEVTGITMKNYLIEKYHWTEQTFRDIAWEAHERALKKFSDSVQEVYRVLSVQSSLVQVPPDYMGS